MAAFTLTSANNQPIRIADFYRGLFSLEEKTASISNHPELNKIRRLINDSELKLTNKNYTAVNTALVDALEKIKTLSNINQNQKEQIAQLEKQLVELNDELNNQFNSEQQKYQVIINHVNDLLNELDDKDQISSSLFSDNEKLVAQLEECLKQKNALQQELDLCKNTSTQTNNQSDASTQTEPVNTQNMSTGTETTNTQNMSTGTETTNTHDMSTGTETTNTHDMSTGTETTNTHDMSTGTDTTTQNISTGTDTTTQNISTGTDDKPNANTNTNPFARIIMNVTTNTGNQKPPITETHYFK